MLKWFITPTGGKIEIKDALNGGLSEYYPLPYLIMCAEERQWKGKPSTTQLLNGTRLSYLSILSPYALNPKDQAFRIIGTRGHGKLEKFTSKKSFSELNIPDYEISGIVDLLEQQPDGSWHLIDYKVWGSYKVTLALGLEEKKRPAVDEYGNPIVYQKSGKWGKAGEQKIEKFYIRNPLLVNIPEVELQINRYKIVIENYFEIKINKMKVFIIVRDGNTYIAENRGIIEGTYYVDIQELDRQYVNDFFENKRSKLIEALDGYRESYNTKYNSFLNDSWLNNNPDYELLKNNCPRYCDAVENWNGRKCQKYCQVYEICQRINLECQN